MKTMGLEEFVRLGFLQEANRLFFNPHGLALAMEEDAEGVVSFGEILDAREDPEGIVFQNLTREINAKKAALVQAEYERHVAARTKLFCPDAKREQFAPIQPIGHKMNEEEK